MKYYKTEIKETKNILDELKSLNDFAKFSGIKQPYLYKVWKGDLVISEKQYNRILNFIELYKKHENQVKN